MPDIRAPWLASWAALAAIAITPVARAERPGPGPPLPDPAPHLFPVENVVFPRSCDPDAPRGHLRITVDNVMTAMYVNGTELGIYGDEVTDWTRTSLVDVVLIPGRNVIAVQADDQGVIAGLLAELRVCDSVLGSTEAWRVSTTAPRGWYEPDFDDSSWAPASLYGDFPGGVWGTRVHGMDGARASWIWSDVNTQDGDIATPVYFRFTFELSPGWVVR